MGDRVPWCCHPTCSLDAELRLRDTRDGIPYDQRETDSCVEHADYLGRGDECVIVVGLLPALVSHLVALTGVSLRDDEVGEGTPVDEAGGIVVHEAEARDRGFIKRLACRCGAGAHPDEAPDAGLYLGEDGSLERICGKCWQVAALSAVPMGAR